MRTLYTFLVFIFLLSIVQAQDFWEQTNGPHGGLINALAINASGDIFAGTTGGDVPTQRLYFLGGPYTLRGFDVGNPAGSAYW